MKQDMTGLEILGHNTYKKTREHWQTRTYAAWTNFCFTLAQLSPVFTKYQIVF